MDAPGPFSAVYAELSEEKQELESRSSIVFHVHVGVQLSSRARLQQVGREGSPDTCYDHFCQHECHGCSRRFIVNPAMDNLVEGPNSFVTVGLARAT